MAKSEFIGGEQITWDVPLNGSGANAGFNFIQEGILFSLRAIPLSSVYAASGSPTFTLRNGNDIVINNKQYTTDTTSYPQAATQTIALVATGLYVPFLFVGQSSVVVTGGAANGYLRLILKMYP